jgi:GTP1/OBG
MCAFLVVASGKIVESFSIRSLSLSSSSSIRHSRSTSSSSLSLMSEVFDADKQQQQQQQQVKSKSRTTKSTVSASSSIDDPEWKFFDTARIHVTGGNGGSGCVAFRREKGEARGGPNGGRGGRGGNIVLICDDGLNTLLPLQQRVHVRASHGRNGQGKNKDGFAGNDIEIAVPPGTVVRDLSTQRLAGELRVHGEQLIVARGGRGGRGNFAFKTAQRTAPKFAERGEPGMQRWLSIELRLLADVGFLGMPNAGKRYATVFFLLINFFVK